MTCAGAQSTQIPLLSQAGTEFSCCVTVFLSSSFRYQPVHLWSTEEDGSASIAATYKCINALDELSHAFSVAVSQDGESIYCGLKGEVCSSMVLKLIIMTTMRRYVSLIELYLDVRVGLTTWKVRGESSLVSMSTPLCPYWPLAATTRRPGFTAVMGNCYASSQGRLEASLRC